MAQAVDMRAFFAWLFWRLVPPAERKVTLADWPRLEAQVKAKMARENALMDQWLDEHRHEFPMKEVQIITAGGWTIAPRPTLEQLAECMRWTSERMNKP